MRFRSDTQRTMRAALSAAILLLTGGQALALGCADIPGAKVDLSLDTYVSGQSYGRLLPEFNSNNKSEEKLRNLPIDRLIGKRLQLEDGTGHVWLTLTQKGTTEIAAVAGDSTATAVASSKLADLDNTAYNGKLARTFFSLGIAWTDFAEPLIPAIDLAQVPSELTIARVAQTTLRLSGKPKIETEKSVEFACSSQASFVGDPSQLSSLVVL
ncbi:MAG: hypothetical protein ACR2OM_04365, partial [Aestuariivirgaceae bacterium]